MHVQRGKFLGAVQRVESAAIAKPVPDSRRARDREERGVVQAIFRAQQRPIRTTVEQTNKGVSAAVYAAMLKSAAENHGVHDTVAQASWYWQATCAPCTPQQGVRKDPAKLMYLLWRENELIRDALKHHQAVFRAAPARIERGHELGEEGLR